MSCPVCQEPGQFRCSACKEVSYCSAAHQKKDLKSHRVNCSPFIIKDGVNGKYFVAGRNLKAGLIVLAEEPLFYSPHWGDQSSFFVNSNNPRCTGCGYHMVNNKSNKCSTCKWHVCGAECEKRVHGVNECRVFFASQKIKFPLKNIVASDMYCLLQMLRGYCLKKNSLEKFKKLMELQHIWPQNNTSLSKMCEESFDKFIGLFPQLKAEKEFCTRLIRVNLLNCFTTDCSDELPDGKPNCWRSAVYVYAKASRINHSCTPNCSWIVRQRPFKINIITSAPVEKGQELSVCYAAHPLTFGTLPRQIIMREQMGFDCKCPRCLDVTECGTYMSGVICPKCRHDFSGRGQMDTAEEPGYLLPANPLHVKILDYEGNWWKCGRCSTIVHPTNFIPLVNKIFNEYQEMQRVSSGSIEKYCLDILEEECESFLHKNHWIVQVLKSSIVDSQYQRIESMSKEGLETFVEMCSYLVDKLSKTTKRN